MRIDAVGVVGLGTMGAGIAEVFARSGLSVVAVEVDEALVAAGRSRVEKSLQRAVDRGRLDAGERAEILSRFSFTSDRGELSTAGLVIEAVPERLEIKAALFGELDRICPSDTILASNTSSLPVTEIAARTGRPGRVIGMHFFNPAPVMRLVEVVHTVLTDAEVVETVRGLAERCGKTPVVVTDRAGFVANALLFGYLNQAARMAETRHATIADIDLAMRAACGFPMGPLSLMDMIGLDVCLEVLEVMYDETRDQRYAASSLLRRLVMAGQLGRKSGRGYYSYDAEAPVPAAVPAQEHSSAEGTHDGATFSVSVTGTDPGERSAVAKLLAVAGLAVTDAAIDADLVVHVPAAPRQNVVVELAPRTAAGHAALGRARAAIDAHHEVVVTKDRPGHLVEALLFPHLNDAARMVDEAYASRADVDAAMRLGCGYPEGPFEMLIPIGSRTVADGMDVLAGTMPSAAAAPSPLLRELADL